MQLERVEASWGGGGDGFIPVPCDIKAQYLSKVNLKQWSFAEGSFSRNPLRIKPEYFSLYFHSHFIVSGLFMFPKT